MTWLSAVTPTSLTMPPQIIMLMIVFVRFATSVVAAVTLSGVSYLKVGEQSSFPLP